MANCKTYTYNNPWIVYYLEFVSNICTVEILVYNSYESSLHEIKTLRKIQSNEHGEYIKPCKQA